MSNDSTQRQLPVCPDLAQLEQEAQDLASAEKIDLAPARLQLAHSYGAESWDRIVQCCQLIDAIWRDDPETVRNLVQAHPNLLHENAGIRNNNWGPPMSYAANLGRDRIIKLLYELGARDLKTAMGRAVLQGKIGTARMLHELLGSPPPPEGASLHKQLHSGYGPRYDVDKMYEYRNVTALGWGRQFHAKVFVSEPALRLIEQHGGVE
jgi:hypothetical protein